jgi:hypothetical protein
LNSSNNIVNSISPQQVLSINNKLRSLGLNPALKGTKFINKAIQLLLISDDDFYVLEDIYDTIASNCPSFNSAQIRNAIKYSLDHRNEDLSFKNFEKIFGFEYDEYIFTNKNFIEEFINTL